MDRNKVILGLMAFFVVVALAMVASDTKFIKGLISVGNNGYPQASIEVIDNPDGVDLNSVNLKIRVSDPSSDYPQVKLYRAAVTGSGHQDSWTELGTRVLERGEDEVSFTTNKIYGGKMWLMVNVNDNTDRNRKACTGNPTYTAEELKEINWVSCGPESAVVLEPQAMPTPMPTIFIRNYGSGVPSEE